MQRVVEEVGSDVAQKQDSCSRSRARGAYGRIGRQVFACSLTTDPIVLDLPKRGCIFPGT